MSDARRSPELGGRGAAIYHISVYVYVYVYVYDYGDEGPAPGRGFGFIRLRQGYGGQVCASCIRCRVSGVGCQVSGVRE